MPDEQWVWLADMAISAFVGSFGTAYIHQRTGRDTSTGGLVGLLVGGALGRYALVSLWVSLLVQPNWLTGRMSQFRKPWYLWWRWW